MVLKRTCSMQSCMLLLSFLSDPPPARQAGPILTLYSVCVCVWVLGDIASLLRGTESEAAGAADADRLFAGRASWGTERERMSERRERGKPQELKQTLDQTSEQYREN